MDQKVAQAKAVDPHFQKFNVKVSWVQANSLDSKTVEEFVVRNCSDTITVKQLKRKIQTFVGRHKVITIVFQSKVLLDETKTIYECGIKFSEESTHSVVITAKSSSPSRPRSPPIMEVPESPNAITPVSPVNNPPPTNFTPIVNNKAPASNLSSEPNQNSLLQENLVQEEEDTEDDEKICRICFDGTEDEETGKLFSPCKCKGSMRYVHVACLNHWRQVSTEKNYYQCPQCLYKYNIQRKDWADYIDNPTVIQRVSIFIVIIIVLVLGFAFSFTGLQDKIYEKLQWFPRDYWNHVECTHEGLTKACNAWLEHLPHACWNSKICTVADDFDFYVDVVFFGCGFISAYGIYLQRARLNWMHLGVMLMAGGAPQMRFFLILGVGYCMKAVYERVAVVAKTIVTRFGEYIREVS